MLALTETVRIERAPDQVWPHIADLELERSWRAPYVVRLEADGDPLVAGTQVRGTTRAFGMTDTYRNVVTAVVPHERLEWRGVEASGGLIGTAGAYELDAPEAGITDFRVSIAYAPQGFWGWMQAPVLGIVLRRVLRRFLGQLKDEVEDDRAALRSAPDPRDREARPMAVTFVLVDHFVGGTAEQYENTLAAVHPDGGAGLPPGQVAHYGGPTADGWVIVGLWDSEESWARFRDGTLAPRFASVENGLPGPPEEITFTVHNAVSA